MFKYTCDGLCSHENHGNTNRCHCVQTHNLRSAYLRIHYDIKFQLQIDIRKEILITEIVISSTYNSLSNALNSFLILRTTEW